jgi:acyl-CoA dehydrogenase
MDLMFTPEQDEFREELRTWFAANAPTEEFDPPYTPRGLEQHKEWEARLFAAGYSAPAWPVEAGGMGKDLWGQLIYDEEYARHRLPERLNKMGLLHGGPTVMAHGTPEQKRDWLPGILDCSDIWCQGFSEPDAGSDLASLRTTAIVDGDHMVINGQKTWTSNGPFASRIFALVRTDPSAPKHQGISFVVFDLDQPGVDLRPMRQLHAKAGFAEVFFDNVTVPLANVVGGLNNGWRVAATSLRLERGTGRGTHTRLTQSLDGLVSTLRETPEDAVPHARLGSLRAWTYAYVQATYALTDRITRGGDDGVPSSVNKLMWSETQTAIYEAHLDALGADAEILDSIGPEGEFLGTIRDYWHSRAGEIFAGTSEIQRNIIAERGLGLPREAKA